MQFFGQILLIIINVYLLLLTIRVLLSWFTLPPYSWVNWIRSATDPVVNFFRKNFPIRIGFLDLSILIPFFLFGLLSKIISDFTLAGRVLSFFYFIEIILYILYFIFSFMIFGLFIATILLLIVNLISPQTYNPVITMLRSIIDPIVFKIRRVIPLKSRNADVIYLVITALIVAIIGGIGSWFLQEFLPVLLAKLFA